MFRSLRPYITRYNLNLNPLISVLSSDINFALRKIVCLLKPTKEITHDLATGAMKIRTLTTFKNFNMDFTIGEEFTEDLGAVDGRTCQVWLWACSLCQYHLLQKFSFVCEIP
ncbi:hypothetical protein XENOCAPTIV_018872 [Xenoophorus captivus]|uniref:Lipocalin/cytosolic fatty-acid binding domain-containing protein n=1 Tax=Xenoophorus captivus TaxID=1517983 RepID=A0ABV0RI12_9TELE